MLTTKQVNTERTFTILVVDDSDATRKLFSSELSKDGQYTVLQAESGLRALEVFRTQHPNLVLLDIDMPDMDGYEVAQQIRSQEAGYWTPIIFLSALNRDPDILRGIEAGGDDYLVKPVRSTILEAKIRVMRRLLDMQNRLMVLTKELNEANLLLNRAVELDSLTQLINRRGFDRILQQEIEIASRDQQPLTLLLVDVDHFKLFNDHYGHVSGDQCLQRVAKILSEVCIRENFVAARYGGEEFALVLPRTSRSAAMTFARAIMHMVKHERINHATSPVADHITFSGGITTVVPDSQTNSEGLLRRADEALYAAKSMGRNRFFSFELKVDTSDHRLGK